QRESRLLTDQIDETGVVDAHDAGVRGGGDRGGRAGGAVDDGHLAEELALAERHDDGLVRAADLGDVDLAVEHDIEVAPGRAFLEDDVADAVFVDAFLDGHGAPAFWLKPLSMKREKCRASRPPPHVSRETGARNRQGLRQRGFWFLAWFKSGQVPAHGFAVPTQICLGKVPKISVSRRPGRAR